MEKRSDLLAETSQDLNACTSWTPFTLGWPSRIDNERKERKKEKEMEAKIGGRLRLSDLPLLFSVLPYSKD